MADIEKIFGHLKTMGRLVTDASSQGANKDLDTCDWAATELGRLVLTIDDEMRSTGKMFFDMKASDSETYQALRKHPEKKAELARFLFENRHRIFKPPEDDRLELEVVSWTGFRIFTGLMHSTLPIEPDELLDWIVLLKETHIKVGRRWIGLNEWPIGYMVQTIERKSKKDALSDTAVDKLRAILGWPELQQDFGFWGTDFAKVRKRIEKLIFESDGIGASVRPYKKLSGDQFGDALQAEIEALSKDEAEKWHRVFNLASSASQAKPTKTFHEDAKSLKQDLGKEWVRSRLHGWFAHALDARVIAHNRALHGFVFTADFVFTRSNVTLLKGLVWLCEGFQDAITVNLVADLCEKSMKKIPNMGPPALATANACLRYLEMTPGVDAMARLSRLRTRIKQKSVQKKVAEIVTRKAEAAGLTVIQLEERVVPTYGFAAGRKSVAFGDYSLEIVVEGAGKIAKSWLKPDGSAQKAAPKIVAEKAEFKARYDKVKGEVAALKKVLAAQRDRIDRLFAEDLAWPVSDVLDYYVGHDVVFSIAARLIWTLEKGDDSIAAIWRGGTWQDVSGGPVECEETTKVRLWHPVDCDLDEVMAWRSRLAELGIVQPIKQAHREVYHLTDAERNTRIYSNRMAAHILKQHQMATLMAARGWKYQLNGPFDNGVGDQMAFKPFVTSELSAEFLILTDWNDENLGQAGIFYYVGTDQLRFVRNGVPVELETVPVRLFSETMREADLFVGVASVGNDPAWFDQGPTPQARDYWQSYSFGDLDNFAETRKAVLEPLLPRLKIRNVAHIDGKYLIVDGKLNTYKIHLGSSNILMSPGDRYLCIMPGSVSKSGQVVLPFEGDNRLSVILSKALMLADDDRITAPDIVSQLK